MQEKISKIIVITVVLLVIARSCVIRTPEIHGTVIDAETKQPVEGAWVTGGLSLKSITIAGDVSSYPSVEKPHTRTGKDGTFVIPSRTFMRILIPVRFFSKVDSFGIGASTADWRGGGADLTGSMWYWKKDVTIAIDKAEKDDEKQMAYNIKIGMSREKAEEFIEKEYFDSIQSLYDYCISGRFNVETPAVPDRCDDWELDYVIKKHEWFVERFQLNKNNRSRNSLALEQLGSLYEKKGNYAKAIEFYKKARKTRFFRPQDLDAKIHELEKL